MSCTAACVFGLLNGAGTLASLFQKDKLNSRCARAMPALDFFDVRRMSCVGRVAGHAFSLTANTTKHDRT